MITPAENDAGLLAYEQVLAFAAVRRRRLSLIYVLFPILLVIAGAISFVEDVWNLGVTCVFSAGLFAFIAVMNWRRLRARDVRNRALLAELRAKYGDDLPWLEVERQMTEIRRIQAERDGSPEG